MGQFLTSRAQVRGTEFPVQECLPWHCGKLYLLWECKLVPCRCELLVGLKNTRVSLPYVIPKFKMQKIQQSTLEITCVVLRIQHPYPNSPSLQVTLSSRTCNVCGLYMASIKSLKNHKKACTAKGRQGNNEITV